MMTTIFFCRRAEEDPAKKHNLDFLDYIASVDAKAKGQQYHRGYSSLALLFFVAFSKGREHQREQSEDL